MKHKEKIMETADLGGFIVAELQRQVIQRGGFLSDGSLDGDGSPIYPLVGIDAEIDVEELAQGILERIAREAPARNIT
jgi:hypothetical protein